MAMATENTAENGRRTFRVMRGGRPETPPRLMNLLRDTSAPVIVYLAERHGLRRVPGLSREDLIERILRRLPEDALRRLEDDLIAARYGGQPIEELLGLIMASDARRLGRSTPRLDAMPPEDATLIEKTPGRWVYTMHGYDVTIDLNRRRLACGCPFFRFSAGRQALCKHLARALTLIPQVYAREVLIDLLVSREYGGPDAPNWEYDSPKAA
jgi:hypothetical protein